MFLNLAKERRSVRVFKDTPVEDEKIEQIIEAGLRSPSGRARRPFHFIIVTEKESIEKMAVAKEHGAAFLKSAPLAIVVCGDPQVSELWIEDCSIAAVTMQYESKSLGLDSCWGHMRDKTHSDSLTSTAYIADLLGIPANLQVECVLGIGYSDQKTAPYNVGDLKFEQVSTNRYGNTKK